MDQRNAFFCIVPDSWNDVNTVRSWFNVKVCNDYEDSVAIAPHSMISSVELVLSDRFWFLADLCWIHIALIQTLSPAAYISSRTEWLPIIFGAAYIDYKYTNVYADLEMFPVFIADYCRMVLICVVSSWQEQFHDRTPYSIMFGPDKCGEDYKLHFIFRHKNPLNNDLEEKHAKRANVDLKKFYTDKKTHLYTLGKSTTIYWPVNSRAVLKQLHDLEIEMNCRRFLNCCASLIFLFFVSHFNFLSAQPWQQLWDFYWPVQCEPREPPQWCRSSCQSSERDWRPQRP